VSWIIVFVFCFFLFLFFLGCCVGFFVCGLGFCFCSLIVVFFLCFYFFLFSLFPNLMAILVFLNNYLVLLFLFFFFACTRLCVGNI